MIKQAVKFSALSAIIAFGASAGAVAAVLPLPDASNPHQAAVAVKAIRDVLATPPDKMDFARAEMTFEKLVDPSIDTDIMLGQIERMTQSVRLMAGPKASHAETLAALKTYIYQPGPWNDFKPYSYDFTDPYGRDFTHALVSRYLTTRRGNCVSMPFLFIMLGDRLGLKVTAAMATRHIFVKYTDDDGKIINMETTSGANPARDAWLRQIVPMSDAAVASGAYMSPLTRRQTLAVMAAIVLESDRSKNRYAETTEVARILLQVYPKFIQAMIFRADALERTIDVEFGAKYSSPELIPPTLRARYLELAREDRASLDGAAALGWREQDYRPRAIEAPASAELAALRSKSE